jgi:hypothetical protein
MSQVQMQDDLINKFLNVMNGDRRMYSAHMDNVHSAGVKMFEAKGYTNDEAQRLVMDARQMAHLEYSHVCGK